MEVQYAIHIDSPTCIKRVMGRASESARAPKGLAERAVRRAAVVSIGYKGVVVAERFSELLKLLFSKKEIGDLTSMKITTFRTPQKRERNAIKIAPIIYPHTPAHTAHSYYIPTDRPVWVVL
jgi:hypothetical protein